MVLEFAWKLAFALAIGGLVGLEREKRTHHEVGFRTFSLTCFMGMLLTTVTESVLVIALGLGGIFALSALYYYNKSRSAGRWGVTTAIMLPATFVLGVFVGLGFYVEAALSAIAAVYILIEKSEVHSIVERVTKNEIIDLLVFAVISFIAYYQIPHTEISFLGVELGVQYFFTIVALITGISFAAYIMMKYVGKKAAVMASFLGGIVSSLAVVAVMAGKTKHHPTLASVIALASAGSVFGDIILLAAISTAALSALAPTLLAFFLAYLALSVWNWHTAKKYDLHLPGRPLSLKFIVEFSVAFIAVYWLVAWTAANLPQDYLVLSGFAGGILSSTSTLAALALLYTQGKETQTIFIASAFTTLLGSLSAKVLISGITSKAWKENVKFAAIVTAAGAISLAVQSLM